MASASGSASQGRLQRMVAEADVVPSMAEKETMDLDDGGEDDGRWVVLQNAGVGEGAYEGKGKGRMAAMRAEENEERHAIEDKPFRLFDLPTEIRLEIYRACLTRPYNILLSKPDKPAPKVEEKWEIDADAEGLDALEIQQLQAAGANVRSSWLQQPARGSGGGTSQTSSRRRGVNRGPARPTLRAASSSSSGSQPATGSAPTPQVSFNHNLAARQAAAQKVRATLAPPRPQTADPLLVNILRTSKTVYKEARDVLYSENNFSLDIFTAVASLAALHQRSRRRIKHVELEIPTYTEILESFSETVRLSLRYCSGLRKLVIHTPFSLPGGDGAAGSGNTTVYANGFDILRWLPQGCHVVIEGTKNKEIDAVVGRHMRLAGCQDKVSWEPSMFLQQSERTGGAGRRSEEWHG